MGNCRKSCEFSSPPRPRCLIQSASEFMEKDKSHRHVTYFSFYSPVDGAVPRCDVPFGTMRIVIINSQTVFPPMCAQSRAKFLGEWLTEVEWSIERVDLLALAVPLRESQVNLLFSHVQLGGSSVLFDVSLGRHQAAPDCGPYSSGYAERRMEAKQILRLASFLADVHPFFPAVPSAVSAPRPTSIGSSEPPVLFSRGSLESPASPRTRITKRIRFILYFASYQLVNYLQLISPPRDSSGFNPFSRPPYFYFIIFVCVFFLIRLFIFIFLLITNSKASIDSEFASVKITNRDVYTEPGIECPVTSRIRLVTFANLLKILISFSSVSICIYIFHQVSAGELCLNRAGGASGTRVFWANNEQIYIDAYGTINDEK